MTENSTAPRDSGEPPRKKHKGAKVTAWTLGAVVVVAGGAYVASALLTQDRLPAHLSIDGVDVSGQNADQARSTLTKAFDERASKQITLAAGKDGDNTATITPAEAGLGVDVDATVSKYTGLSWDPVTIWSRITGSQDGRAETTVDRDALKQQVQAAARSLDSKAKEGNVTFVEGRTELTDPSAGTTMDQELTAKALEEQWLNTEGDIDADVKQVSPKVSKDAWKDFVDSTADPLVADPITVSDGERKAELTPTQLGSVAKVRVSGSKPKLELDPDQLLKQAVKTNPELKSTGRDASFKLVGKAGHSRTKIVPAKPGRGMDAKDLSQAVLKASTQDDRSATVKPKVTDPEISTAAAKKWKLEPIAEFGTDYPVDDTVRNKNLKAGSARVNGTVVEPGKEFNLADVFGPITTENGYFASGVVTDGLSTTALGGGLSQIATMSYNAGFLSGMDIVEHKAHSRWFDRYPAGRESTFWEGEINVRWKNNTPSPVAVEMWVSPEQVKMRVWGEKYWKVKTKSSDHYNITNPQTKHSSGPKCVPEHTGIQGFTIDVTRDRSHAGKARPQEKFTTTYGAWPNVSCG